MAVAHCERHRIEGTVVEAGCALGGSAIVLAAAKSPTRKMEVYDVFGEIPAPSERDDADVHARYSTIRSGAAAGLGGDIYYGYREDLLETVRGNFEAAGLPVETNRIDLVKGLFEETLNPSKPVALAHIDGDWYESVAVCLERIHPILAVGGTIVIDDYFAWSGARKAVDDFLLKYGNTYRRQRRSRLHLIKR